MQIVLYPHPALKTKAESVEIFDEALEKFTQEMLSVMKNSHGIGLAANQVGDLRRIIVIDVPQYDVPKVLINPVILKSEGKTTFQEGCLSFPGLYEFISDRAEALVLVAKDVKGNEFLLSATGLLAVCIQHEIDHLDGKVFLDRMSRLKRQIAMKKLSEKL